MLTENVSHPWLTSLAVRLTAANDYDHQGFITPATSMLYGKLFGYEYVTHPLDLYQLVGATKPGSSEPYSNEYAADRPPDRNLSVLYDSPYSLWAARFNSMHSLLSGNWDFQRGRSTVPHENPVRHRNLFGFIEASDHENKYYSRSNDPTYDLNDVFQLYSFGGNDYFRHFPTGSAGTSSPILMDAQNLNAIKDSVDLGQEDAYHIIPWVFVLYRYNFTVVERTASSLTIKWNLIAGSHKTGVWIWDVSLYELHISLTPLANTCDYDVDVPLSDNFSLVAHLKLGQNVINQTWNPPGSVSREVLQGHYSPTVDLDVDTMTFHATVNPSWSLAFAAPPFVGSRVPELIGYDTGTERFISGPGTYVDFHRKATHIFPSFAAGNFISTQNALDGQFGMLEGNYIETIVELRDILSPIDLIKAIKTYVSRSKLTFGLLGLLKFLGAADLTYRFGIAPTIRDARDLRGNLLPILRKLQSPTYKEVTLHGKASFVLDEEIDGFPAAVVVARSKVRLGVNADSMLPYLLPLNSLGLLPSFSRIWDIIPFSWAIDGLVNISVTGQLLDAALLQLLYTVEYSTHTISTIYNFGDDVLKEHDLADAGGPDSEGAGYKLFVRYSLYKSLPVLGPTILPLFRPTTSLSWDVIGSVLVGRK